MCIYVCVKSMFRVASFSKNISRTLVFWIHTNQKKCPQSAINSTSPHTLFLERIGKTQCQSTWPQTWIPQWTRFWHWDPVEHNIDEIQCCQLCSSQTIDVKQTASVCICTQRTDSFLSVCLLRKCSPRPTFSSLKSWNIDATRIIT